MAETYESSGVDIAAGEEAVKRIKEHVRSTFRPEAIGDIGGFGGLFDFTRHGYKKPVLVSTTDGVGTKALVASAAGRFNTIGIDLVAMCVDDLVCQGPSRCSSWTTSRCRSSIPSGSSSWWWGWLKGADRRGAL